MTSANRSTVLRKPFQTAHQHRQHVRESSNSIVVCTMLGSFLTCSDGPEFDDTSPREIFQTEQKMGKQMLRDQLGLVAFFFDLGPFALLFFCSEGPGLRETSPPMYPGIGHNNDPESTQLGIDQRSGPELANLGPAIGFVFLQSTWLGVGHFRPTVARIRPDVARDSARNRPRLLRDRASLAWHRPKSIKLGPDLTTHTAGPPWASKRPNAAQIRPRSGATRGGETNT